MKFSKFQSVCKYAHYVYSDPDDHTRMEYVCSKADQVPVGESWGKCDEPYCPYFGQQISNVMIGANNAENLIATSGRIVYNQ